MSDRPPRSYERLEWMPNYATQQEVLLSLCPDCGSVVADRKKHDTWHVVGGATS